MSNNNTSLIISDLPDLEVPLLPPIADEDLRRKVFTHVSHIGAPTTRVSFLERGTVAGDYEELEHVGDAILQSSVTRLLHDIFPHMNHGSATILRSQLLKNETLAQISDKYGLSDTLVAHPAQAVMLRRNGSVKAALFEAYIAGVYYLTFPSSPKPSGPPAAPSAGAFNASVLEAELCSVSRVDAWLRLLFEPLARWAADELQGRIECVTLTSDVQAYQHSSETVEAAKMILDQYFEKPGAFFSK